MIDQERLTEFEKGLNPRHIEKSAVPASILGYGEISTVFAIEDDPSIAFKRMPLFRTMEEATAYQKNYEEYCDLLRQAGVWVAPDETAIIEVPGRPVTFYILQERLPPHRFCHKLIHSLGENDFRQMLEKVVILLSQVWEFNSRQRPRKELAIDGQLSNWVVMGEIRNGKLAYVDTSTPLYRIDGVEQLDPELFLQSAPSFLRWIIRWLFLEGVMNRYYDRRQVLVDLVANFYKEQREDLVPLALPIVNRVATDVEPLVVEEVKKYYSQDKFIWALFLGFRRLDRWLTTVLMRRRYEFVLPGKIKR